MRKLIVGLLLAFLLAGCAPTATAPAETEGGTKPAVQETAGYLSQSELAALSDEQKAEYWLNRAANTDWVNRMNARASLSQAYYLKLIYQELKKQNELLAKISEGRGN